jgi:hypothetical protein
LSEWECELLNGPSYSHYHRQPPKKRTSISVFTLDGRSETFEDVQVDTVDVRTIGSIGSFKVLSFKTLDFRTVNVLDISYWTVDEK